MKQTLLHLAGRVERQVLAYAPGPKNQTTDAMKAFGTDLAKILRAEAEVSKDVDIEALVAQRVTEELESLTGTRPKTTNKKGFKS